jgi:protein-S-isoprenylcysteine O-methyltransferase Ste14
MNPEFIFRAVCFGVLAAAFTISAVYRKRARDLGGTIERREEGWLALVLRMTVSLPLLAVLLLNIFWPASLSWAKFNPPAWLRYVSAALAVLCLPALEWVFRSIGKNISETVLIKDDHELVTRGPYQWVRHPLYGTALVMLMSFSFILGDWIIFGYSIAGLLAFRLLVIPVEEKKLLDAFGEDYECYQSRTGALLPWIR